MSSVLPEQTPAKPGSTGEWTRQTLDAFLLALEQFGLSIDAKRIRGLGSAGMAPIGATMIWHSNTLPPDDEGIWLFSDGSAIPAQYTLAIARLGANLPDYRGVVLAGKAAAGTFSTLNATGGVETVTLTAAQSGLPTHTHAISGGHFLITPATAVLDTQSGADRRQLLGQAADTLGPTGGAQNASASHSNLQPYRVTNFITRVG